MIHAANFLYFYGGITHPLILGEQQQIITYRDHAIVLDSIEWVSVFLLGLYFLSLFQMRTKERSWLYFGLFCLMGCLFVSVQGQKLFYFAFPDTSYEWILKIQSSSGAVATYFLLRYTQFLFPSIFHPLVLRVNEFIVSGWCLFILVTPAYLYSRFGFMYFFAFLLFLYLLYVMAVGALRRMEGSIYMMFSVISIMTIMALIYISISGTQLPDLLLPLSILSFLFSQVLLMSSRFTTSFSTVERLSERLISMDKLKDEFLAQTSHEMRTPLHGVINIAQSLLEGAAGGLSAVQISNMSLIVSTGKRMAHLLNDILDLSKLENNDVKLEPKLVELRPLVHAIFEVLHATAANKSIKLINRLEIDGVSAFADENRLSQILYNLVGNAIKFTEKGEITIQSKRQGDWIWISVIDNGIGIQPDMRGVIFDAYQQGGIARQYGGTGLGLSITKRLVELHGGTIQVESHPGLGSIFSFSIPAAGEGLWEPAEELVQREPERQLLMERAEALTVLPTRMEFLQQGEVTVLVVDDDPANRQVLLNLLSIEKYSVIAVASGAEALLELDHRHDFDIVILDLMMPGMNGYEVCHAIRQRFSLLDLPIVMLTARNWPEDMLAGFSAGVNDFLGKPVDAAELKARIRTLLDMKQSASEKVRMEMAFLQAQIKPHFLFNTLNTIMAVSYYDVPKAQELLSELSGYLRGSFDFHNHERFIPLHRELELVDSYIFIEQARFGDRLRVVRDLDEGLQCLIPPLTIQPIVENAVRHGVTKRPEGGTVTITVHEEDDGILIEVADNGPGIPPDKLDTLLTGGASTGVGLINIERRLRTQYGTGLEITSNLGSGTRIRIRLNRFIPISP